MPAMGLGMEKADPQILDRPPHDIKRGIFTNEGTSVQALEVGVD